MLNSFLWQGKYDIQQLNENSGCYQNTRAIFQYSLRERYQSGLPLPGLLYKCFDE